MIFFFGHFPLHENFFGHFPLHEFVFAFSPPPPPITFLMVPLLAVFCLTTTPTPNPKGNKIILFVQCFNANNCNFKNILLDTCNCTQKKFSVAVVFIPNIITTKNTISDKGLSLLAAHSDVCHRFSSTEKGHKSA